MVYSRPVEEEESLEGLEDLEDPEGLEDPESLEDPENNNITIFKKDSINDILLTQNLTSIKVQRIFLMS